MNKNITPVRFRLMIQAAFTLFNIYVGFRFAAFVAWATSQSATFVPKPGAVEGFLPISALLGLRQLLATGQWDMIHPAGLTIFLAVLVMALLFRKGFCAYICPVGFLSNLLDHAGRRIKLSLVPRKWADYPLTGLKYIGLGFFLYSVFLAMSLRSVQGFLTAPFNVVSEAKMLAFFTHPTALSLSVLVGLLVLTLVVRNAWCRYLCPYGALLGLFSWFSPTAVVRDEASCIGCGKCTRNCPGAIEVEKKKTVRTPECIGCMECVGGCPVEGCLTVRTGKGARMPWKGVAAGCVAVLLAFWLWARITGHWNAEIPPDALQRLYTKFLGAG